VTLAGTAVVTLPNKRGSRGIVKGAVSMKNEARRKRHLSTSCEKNVKRALQQGGQGKKTLGKLEQGGSVRRDKKTEAAQR